MDPAAIFHQSLGLGFPRPSHQFFLGRPPLPGPYPWDSPEADAHDAHDAPHRVAHTLTACCRCRHRKTRCDPALPRCLPCERSGSTCEYYDSTKGKRINRSYVVSLQKKVRELEAELSQYTDQESEEPSHDDAVYPGGIVRLDSTDEMPRYLGPSSGTAMTRLLMEEAKKFAESRRIANLIPEVLARRAERRDRMQSVVMGSISGPSSDRKKSYPAHSIIPASSLPSREIVDGLVKAFKDRVQVLAPLLHEKTLDQDVEAVFAGDTDPYKHFVVNMVVAISLQKLGKYAGLPDSYYLNAMRRFEDVVRPQDVKTLQCLVLIGQYAVNTPTRTAIYYMIGLSAKICQQMGLADERTIGLGVSDPQEVDMRRRLLWIIVSQELGLAYSMGRPSCFAKSDDFINVEFFETVADENITPEGILPGPPSDRKLVAIHFCKTRLLQAEIRRVLYDKKRPEPSHESHPWFAEMEQKLQGWLDDCPKQPEWFKSWLLGYYHTMIIALYRPSVQVPRPTARAAKKCFEGSRYIIEATSQQLERGTADITLESLMVVWASLNALLWSISYAEVRAEHPREDAQELAASALEAIKVFSDRWHGSSSAVQLYMSLANACLQSYNVEDETPSPPSGSQLGTPISLAGPISPESDVSRSTPSSQTQPASATSLFNTSPFGYHFDGNADALAAQFAFDNGPPLFQHQPTFRSNSIFESPSTDSNGRRLSHLAPEASAPGRSGNTPPPPKPESEVTPTPTVRSLPTPPESLVPPATHRNNIIQSPSLAAATAQTATPILTPTLHPTSPAVVTQHTPVPIIQVKQQSPEMFTVPQFKPQQQHHQQQQTGPSPSVRPPPPPTFVTPRQPNPNPNPRPPLPTGTATDWFHPLPQFVPPHAYSSAAAAAGGNPPSSSSSYLWPSAPNPFNGAYGAAGGGGVNGGAGGWGFGWGQPQQQQQQQQQQEQYGFAGHHQQQHNHLLGGMGPPGGEQYYFARQGSLSQEQQLELMDVLEAEGMDDIDSFLSTGLGLGVQGAGPGQGQGQGQGQGGGGGGVVGWGGQLGR